MDASQTCPDCGKNNLIESTVTGEFVFGREKPVTLTATGPVLTCQDCGCQIADWRMEKARVMAVGEHFRKVGPQHNHPEDIEIWHRLNSHHRLQLDHVGRCGCYYCLAFFDSKEIDSWIDADQTAMCPRCGIDAVLPATEDLTPETLKRMQQYWFA